MTISVILPNFNHRNFLPEALERILNQTYSPFEILIIDDASTDESVSYIKEMQKIHRSIKLIQNEKNLGPVITVNKGIEHARGKYLAFCSADDHIFPNFFEKTVTVLEKHPELGLCCGDSSHFQNVKPYRYALDTPNFPEKPFYIFTTAEMQNLYKSSLFFIHSNVSLFRKEVVEKMEGYNLALKSLSDWYLNIRIAQNYGIGYIPQPFGAFRFLEKSYSSAQKKVRKNLHDLYRKLFEEIEKENKDFQRFVYESGLLGQIGLKMTNFLLLTPKYWKLFPKAFCKKIHFLGKKFKKKKVLTF